MSSMADAPFRLGAEHERELGALLDRDPISQLFLRGFLAANPVERAWWYGIGAPLRAAVLVLPARLAVPVAPDPADAAELGRHLHDQHRPCLLVGPRASADALWAAWAPEHRPQRWYDQRLYVLDHRPPGDDPPGFRRAFAADAPRVALQAAAMEREDLGTDPRAADPKHHDTVVTERIRAGRTFVIEDPTAPERIVFQVSVGTVHADGAQIGGTYVVPSRRGRGLGVAGVAATCRELLERAPRVTLHVNEANLPAVRCYEHVGFARDAAFRLVVP